MPVGNEIDALLETAKTAVEQAAGRRVGPVRPASPPRVVQEADRASTTRCGDGSERIRRILDLPVPIIVRLAAREMAVSEILQWGRGTIIEFGKPVDHHLELRVNDQCVGHGEAVKVDEKFGLRILSIRGHEARVRSLGATS